MANELAIAMRDAGTELAETFANRDSSGSRTRYGTVTANNGATLDVKLAGGSVSGVPMTTACVGARAGDRVLLTVDGPLITATGILATADNGPYVRLFTGTTVKLVASETSVTLFTKAEFVAKFGREFRTETDFVGAMNGDCVNIPVHVDDAQYDRIGGRIYVTFDRVWTTNIRINWLVALGS